MKAIIQLYYSIYIKLLSLTNKATQLYKTKNGRIHRLNEI